MQETESASKSSGQSKQAKQVRLKVSLILNGTWLPSGACLEALRVPKRLLTERFVEWIS
jgi:hypothetical protein